MRGTIGTLGCIGGSWVSGFTLCFERQFLHRNQEHPLMDDDLRKIPTFIRLSRTTTSILTQNIVLALGIKAVFLVLTFTGHATMWMAVFADMGASMLVVFNGLRLLKFKTA